MFPLTRPTLSLCVNPTFLCHQQYFHSNQPFHFLLLLRMVSNLGKLCFGFLHVFLTVLNFTIYSIVTDRKHSVLTWIEPPLLLKKKYAITASMIQGLYTKKILTNIEMVNFQKWDFLRFFDSTFCHYRSARIERD